VRATRAAAESLSNSLSDASLRSDQRATEATPALAAAMASVLDRVLDPLRATLGTLEAAVGTTTAVATENRDALRALRVATNSEPAVAEIIRTELLGHRRASQQDTGLESVKTELIEEVRRQLQSGPTESLDALHDAVVLNTEALRDALEGDGANAATLAEMRQAIDQLTTSLSGLDGRALIEEVRTTNGGSTDQAAAAVEQIRQATAELTGELTRVVGHAATAAVVAAAAEAVAPAAAQAAVQHVADVLPDLVARAVADHIELATDPLDVIVREATEAALSRAVISAPDREEQPTAEIADVLDAVEAAVLEGAAAAARAEEAAHAAESAARGAEEAATGAAEAAESAADAARGATDAAHGTTDAVWQAAAQLIPPGESVDTDRLTDTITHALTDAVSAMRPPAPAIEGGELTAAMIASVATALDQFGERVDADLDRMGARLAAVADVLERTLAAVEEMATRRGARGEALDLLRQIAAETTSDVRATNNRRRNSVRGTLQK
jgi:hypothetical protein